LPAQPRSVNRPGTANRAPSPPDGEARCCERAPWERLLYFPLGGGRRQAGGAGRGGVIEDYKPNRPRWTPPGGPAANSELSLPTRKNDGNDFPPKRTVRVCGSGKLPRRTLELIPVPCDDIPSLLELEDSKLMTVKHFFVLLLLGVATPLAQGGDPV